MDVFSFAIADYSRPMSAARLKNRREGPHASKGASAEAVSLKSALQEFGFFYALFTFIVSGPSVLALLQMVVERRLTDALQWIVDGYNDISAAVAGAVEPLLAPIIAWLSEVIGWRLELQPYWRPLFILATMLVIGWARTAWRSGNRVSAAAFLLGGAIGAAVGAIAAGLVPPSAPARAVQGLIAAAPLLGVGFGVAAPLAAMDGARERGRLLVGTGLFMLTAIGVAWLAWMAGTGWVVAGMAKGAGVLGLGTALVFIGTLSLWSGLGIPDGPHAKNSTRLGLVLLGGFATALLILVADLVLRVLAG